MKMNPDSSASSFNAKQSEHWISFASRNIPLHSLLNSLLRGFLSVRDDCPSPDGLFRDIAPTPTPIDVSSPSSTSKSSNLLVAAGCWPLELSALDRAARVVGRCPPEDLDVPGLELTSEEVEGREAITVTLGDRMTWLPYYRTGEVSAMKSPLLTLSATLRPETEGSVGFRMVEPGI